MSLAGSTPRGPSALSSSAVSSRHSRLDSIEVRPCTRMPAMSALLSLLLIVFSNHYCFLRVRIDIRSAIADVRTRGRLTLPRVGKVPVVRHNPGIVLDGMARLIFHPGV